MLNQIIHTFAKQPGYALNNQTQELWSWDKQQLLVDDIYMKWLILAVRRTCQLIGFPIAFLMISCVNGLVIRIALLSSNIILVPIMVILQRFRLNEDVRSRSIVYHSMGLIGA
jgi:hypothetical protein